LCNPPKAPTQQETTALTISSSGTSTWPTSQIETLNQNNLRRGDTWESVFATEGPPEPNEIVPGLFLSNIKTAGAYLLGEAPEGFPKVSHILTIISSDSSIYGLQDIPKAVGQGTAIDHLVICEDDAADVNLLQHFERTGEYIHAGITEFLDHKKRNSYQTSPAVQKLQSVKTKDDKLRSRSLSPASAQSTTTATAPPPDSIPHPISGIPVKTTTSRSQVTATPAIGIMSRAQSTSTAVAPYNTNLIIAARKPQTIQGGAVLVHCYAGMSRSATLVTAYLLKYRPELFTIELDTVDETISPHIHKRAIAYVQSKRSIVHPNRGFRLQLQVYNDVLECSLSDPETGKWKVEYVEWRREHQRAVVDADMARAGGFVEGWDENNEYSVW